MELHIQAYLCCHSLQKARRQMLADVAYLPVNHLLVLQRDCLVDATLKLLPNRVNMFVIYPMEMLQFAVLGRTDAVLDLLRQASENLQENKRIVATWTEQMTEQQRRNADMSDQKTAITDKQVAYFSIGDLVDVLWRGHW